MFAKIVGHLFMWSQATESLTNTAVTLRADVNISCDLDIEEIYWYRLKSPDPPVFILRTYSSTYEGAKYENSIFKHKYSVKTNSRLFIRNITTDELGVYYCVKTSEPLKFSNGTKIYISGELFSHSKLHKTSGIPNSDWSVATFCFTSLSFSSPFSMIQDNHVCLFFVCFCLVFLHKKHVSSLFSVSLQVTVKGVIGGSVVLPCSSKEPQHNETLKVYDIIKGKVSLEEQDSSYYNRTEIIREKYLNGNFSLKLNNVQHRDTGIYTCYITNEFLIQNCLTICLIFLSLCPAEFNQGAQARPENILLVGEMICLQYRNSL
uniref:Ig-like domain-containing protein n=1 Tax=Sinocyclocheilus rhinocerous TaxID=307959 RepID=A0A673IRV8_9TELE